MALERIRSFIATADDSQFPDMQQTAAVLLASFDSMVLAMMEATRKDDWPAARAVLEEAVTRVGQQLSEMHYPLDAGVGPHRSEGTG